MKITRDEMFFSKDLIHTLAYVGMFAAAIISVGACKSGIWVAAILAWIVAGIIIGLATISDYKKAELLKKWNKNHRKGYRNKTSAYKISFEYLPPCR